MGCLLPHSRGGPARPPRATIHRIHKRDRTERRPDAPTGTEAMQAVQATSSSSNSPPCGTIASGSPRAAMNDGRGFAAPKGAFSRFDTAL